MATKLDKQRNYGTVHGDIEGRVFEQDGKFFDGDGEEISAKQAAVNKAEADKFLAQQAAEDKARAEARADVAKRTGNDAATQAAKQAAGG